MRTLVTLALWALLGLVYFTLVHWMDREGISGTLFDAHPSFGEVLALLSVLLLRVATLLVFPAMLFAFLVEGVLGRLVRGGRKPSSNEGSAIEGSQIVSGDP